MIRIPARRAPQGQSNQVIRSVPGVCRARELCSVLGPEAWKGRRCFLIGGGPSLRDPSFGPVMAHLQADHELMIGVNKSFVWNPEINYAMDDVFYNLVSEPKNKEHQLWTAYHGLKVFLYQNKACRFDPEVYITHAQERKVLSLDIVQGIWPGNNSGFGALMLATALGCRKIGLLGYDFCVDTEGHTHWHEGYSAQDRVGVEKKLVSFIQCFDEFANVLESVGVDVVNLNPDSALRCFRFADVDTFRKEKIG